MSHLITYCLSGQHEEKQFGEMSLAFYCTIFTPELYKSQIASSEWFGITMTLWLSASKHLVDTRPEHYLQAVWKAAFAQHLVIRHNVFLMHSASYFLHPSVPGNIPPAAPFCVSCVDEDDGGNNLLQESKEVVLLRNGIAVFISLCPFSVIYDLRHGSCSEGWRAWACTILFSCTILLA